MPPRNPLIFGSGRNFLDGMFEGRSPSSVVGKAGVHHGLVLLNTVGGHEDITILSGLVTVRAPGKEVTADLDIIVGELAMLVVIHAKKLGLLRSTELKTGDEIDDLGNGSGHEEGVGGGGNNRGDLPADNNVVAVHEATDGTGVDSVKADDGTSSEEGVEDETDDAADTVLSENIEGIINSDEELD